MRISSPVAVVTSLVLLVAALLALQAWTGTSPSRARRVLASQGYTDITITGYRWFGCGKDDWFHTGFRATSPAHTPITGIVCSGIFKGSTIRLD